MKRINNFYLKLDIFFYLSQLYFYDKFLEITVLVELSTCLLLS